MRVLVTGASGFVGSAVLKCLMNDRRFEAVGSVRRLTPRSITSAQCVEVTSLAPDTKWEHALAGVEVVVHAAARVHVMQDTAADPLAEYRYSNVQGTLNLARQAAVAGARRFVFISSIKVNGEATVSGHPFSAEDTPAPLDPYGISKMEAEDGLREVAMQTGMEVVIIRPPLVYGPGVKANFQSMMRWLQKGIPLPLGAINNRRSLVALDNLVDLIVTCIDHPAAANQVFLVSDGEDISTTQLLRRMGKALRKPARLIPIPSTMLKLGSACIGKPGIGQRLCGSLQVDISKTRELLGWQPVVSVDHGLEKAADDFRLANKVNKFH
jgi:nucleoside-diphosphate-sugar epimerase